MRYRSYTLGPDAVGDIEALSMWTGQGVAMVHKIQPAAEIVREIDEGAPAILRRLAECRLRVQVVPMTLRRGPLLGVERT